jgi:hypothetical protein
MLTWGIIADLLSRPTPVIRPVGSLPTADKTELNPIASDLKHDRNVGGRS